MGKQKMHSRVCACRAGYTLDFAPLSSFCIFCFVVSLSTMMVNKYEYTNKVKTVLFITLNLTPTLHVSGPF